MTGENYVALVLPVLTLAEYRDGELIHVAPCTDGVTVRTVADRIDALAAGTATDTAEAPDDAGEPPRPLLAEESE